MSKSLKNNERVRDAVARIIHPYLDDPMDMNGLEHLTDKILDAVETNGDSYFKASRWKCRRCGEIVNLKEFRCGCTESPSPWEPIV